MKRIVNIIAAFTILVASVGIQLSSFECLTTGKVFTELYGTTDPCLQLAAQEPHSAHQQDKLPACCKSETKTSSAGCHKPQGHNQSPKPTGEDETHNCCHTSGVFLTLEEGVTPLSLSLKSPGQAGDHLHPDFQTDGHQAVKWACLLRVHLRPPPGARSLPAPTALASSDGQPRSYLRFRVFRL